MQIDMPTLFLALLLVGATLSLTTAMSISSHTREGLQYWAIGFAMNASYYLLILSRSHTGPVISILLSNVMFSSGFSMMSEGIFQFQQRSPPRAWIWAPVAVIAVTFPFLFDTVQPRIIIAGVVISIQCVQISIPLLQRRRETVGNGQYLVLAGLAVTLLLLGFRIVAVLLWAHGPSLSTAPGPLDIASFMAAMVCLIVISHGLVVMIKDRADERIRALATQDPLTGLANRRRLDETLASEWSRARRAGSSLALIMMDLDSFKAFNDTYGHQAGDQCLIDVARILKDRTRRAGDLAARYGGEEFLLVLPGLSGQAARNLADQIRLAVETLNRPHARSPHGKVTVSAGVAAFEPGSHGAAEELLSDADKALYAAKEAGGNLTRSGPPPAGPRPHGPGSVP